MKAYYRHFLLALLGSHQSPGDPFDVLQFTLQASKKAYHALMLMSLEYGMTGPSRNYLQSSVWMGGEFGFRMADRVVSLLQLAMLEILRLWPGMN